LVNDKEVREIMLKQMKREWPADGQLLHQLKHYTADQKIQDIDPLLLELAEQYKPEFDRFYPVCDDIDEQQLLDYLNSIDFKQMPLWETEFKALKGLFKTSYKNLWQGVIQPFLHELKSIRGVDRVKQTKVLFSDTFSGNNNVCQVFLVRLPAVYDETHAKSKALDNREQAPSLFALFDTLNDVWSFFKQQQSAQKYQVIPNLLAALKERTQRFKTDNSLISYDDMITRLWQHLQAEKTMPIAEQLLTQSLRNKYQMVMVDEFQDTDIRQWEIFEHLFLQSPDAQHKLLVIGDPKQAIYGFRGADLHTYNHAKAKILHSYHGRAYRLDVNYRTNEPLIERFNEFFAAEKGGWFDEDDVIVKSPDPTVIDPINMPKLQNNPHELSAINALVVQSDQADLMKTELAKQMASTIKNQLIGQVSFQLKGVERLLNPADVCILVRTHSDAVYLEEALRAVNVPYTFLKKKNLYQSIEAIHFQVLLTALARPHEHKRVNNAMLTLFFNLKPDQLADFATEKLPEVTALWLQVKEAVANQDWIKAFDLLLNDSGAMFRARNNSRRLANLRHLKQLVLQTALKNNFEANALLKEFVHWRTAKSNDEDLHQKDTEKQAVKIMTMHISKGLEFPVVFLFGGFRYQDKSRFYTYYDEQQQCMVFDLAKHHQQAYLSQQLKEAEQLYYVAMTRAIFMLFLPLVDESEKVLPAPGFYLQTVMKRLQTFDTPVVSFSAERNDTNIPQSTEQLATKLQPLVLPEKLNTRRRYLHSFSSLSKERLQAKSSDIESDFSQSLASELLGSDDDLSDRQQAKMTIPGGVKTGLVLHGIFENIDFKQIVECDKLVTVYGQDSIMSVVDQQMQQFNMENRELLDEQGQIYSDYRKQLIDWVWHTLRKPLDALQGVCLGDIATSSRCHELSFFWHKEQTHLTGFIDLFFAVNNEANDITDYYILDWKSNLSANGYAPEVLANEVMQKHQYNWQYQLYALAMQRWFDALNLKHARLKGALYVFSRGMDCHESAQNGVFYDDFTEQQWQLSEIEHELLSMQKNGGNS
jgi:exodeoxyribonuclease V beta subunit